MTLLALLGFGTVLSTAHAQEATYALRTFSVEPLERGEAAEPRLLPRGVTGALPNTDGGFFALLVEDGLYPAESTEEIQRALDELLPAVGYEGSARELYPSLEGDPRPLPDMGALEALGEGMFEDELPALERRVGALSPESAAMMKEDVSEVYDRVSADVQVWRFDQYVGRARAEGRSVIVETDGRSILRVVGALYASTKTSNAVEIGSEKAAALAERYAREAEGRSTGEPELVVLADGATLRNTWRVDVETAQGPYQIWVDAQDGDVVQVVADFASVAAQGRESLPTLPLSFDVTDFEVDSAASCKYTLDLSSVLTLSNAAADGVSGDATGCLVGGSTVDFDVAPQNSTTNLTNANGANYNGLFQQVTTFAQVYDTLDWFNLLGSTSLPVWKVTVDHNNPCGFGVDNACGGYGNLTMGIGGVTLGVFGGSLINTALDQSVIVHETGHGLIRAQMKVNAGTLVGSLDEGVADYWAMTRLQTNLVGVVTTNTTSDVENGFIPRAADAPDVFPEHMQNVNEIHANGQIIARAQWASRNEMLERSPIGPLVNDLFTMQALTTAGGGQTNATTFKAVHDAYQGMLISMLVEAGGGRSAEDILVGYAMAGVTATPQEAVIDISDDFLAASDSPPTFTVWTGEDYTFSGSNIAVGSPYNTRYEVEVANDENFTQNLVSSGTQTNVAINGLVPSGTWTLSKADWATLSKGDAIYFRATTWKPNDADSVRTSTHWYGEFVEIAPSRAIINHTGSGGCATAGGGISGLAGLLLSGLALLRRRR